MDIFSEFQLRVIVVIILVCIIMISISITILVWRIQQKMETDILRSKRHSNQIINRKPSIQKLTENTLTLIKFLSIIIDNNVNIEFGKFKSDPKIKADNGDLKLNSKMTKNLIENICIKTHNDISWEHISMIDVNVTKEYIDWYIVSTISNQVLYLIKKDMEELNNE